MSAAGKISVLLMVAIVALSISGCATLFAKKNPDVNFNSDPDGANVYVDGNLMGRTPVKLRLRNNKDYTVEFRKEGYRTRTYVLSKHVGAVWVVLDVLAGFWPVVIDLATGDWYELDTDNVKVLLEK